MPESETFSRLLEQETQKWIDEEISKGNDAWNARRSFDGLSNIHWDMVARLLHRSKSIWPAPART